MTHRALSRAVLSLVLLAAIVPAGPARAAAVSAPSSAACSKATVLYTYKIEASPRRTAYRAGRTALVDMRVTRPGSGDPLGEQTEMPRATEVPAEDVEVSVSIYAGIYYMYGTGITDENGEATIRVKLHRNAPARRVRADTSARSYYNRSGCPDLEEAGFQPYERFLKIIR